MVNQDNEIIHDLNQRLRFKIANKIRNKAIKKLLMLILFLALIISIGIYIKIWHSGEDDNKEEILSVSSLEKIIKISELSTFDAVYNGIAKVMNEKNPDEVDYYVSYESKVYAGIDFEKVKITMDKEAKKITVTLPEIEITDINVDIASLDYIFINSKANTSTVSEQAYKACIADVTSESKEEAAIYELAEQNAKNIMKALISPFIEQLDSDYELEIN